jgi:ligand-binding sensor domain-containing protein/serine phosphatase RsbU (regulator of sigma subunit)
MKSLAGLFSLFFALLCVPDSTYSTGVWKSYTIADGLAGGNVRALIQDRRGDLWIATDGDGVSRYDGEDFQNFSTEDGLANNFVRAILEDGKGDLWFATGTGVCRYDGKSFRKALNVKAGLVDNFATSIIEDREGHLWFGTKGGVSKYDGEEFENFTTEDGLVGDYVWVILGDGEGNLWFGANSGVSRYDGKKFENFTTKNGLANDSVKAILEDSEGNLWFGTDGGVSRYDGKRFENFTTEDGLADNKTRSLLRDIEGNLWFGTVGGVSKYDGKEFEKFTSRDGLVGDHVSAICEDREGNLWFGTWGHGISRYDSRIRHYLKDKTIEYALEDRSGNLWFSAQEGDIFRYDGRTFQDFTSRVGLASDESPAILEDRNGGLWFAGLSGITRYNGMEFQTIEDIGLKDALVQPIFLDSKGNLWHSIWKHGATIRIGRYDGKRFHYFPIRGSIYPSGAEDRKVLEDKEGNIWFVTKEDGIYRYNGVTPTHFTTDDGLAGNKVSSVAEDTAGNLWFGIRENDKPDAEGVGGLSMYSGEFSAESKYQTDLDRGNIPEGLKEAFKNNGFLISQNAGVIVKEAGQKWLIRELLFSVGARIRNDPDTENIPENLEQAFADNGIPLSQNISMGEEAESPWLIVDRGSKQAYTVLKSGDKLNIYDNKQTYVVMKDKDELNISGFLTYSTKDGLSSDSVTGILVDNNGSLWFRTYHGGVSKYDGKRFEKFTMETGLTSNTIRSMLKDDDGGLWFGSQGAGVSQYDGTNFQALTQADGLVNDTAYVALVDSRGDIWFRYDVPGLTRYTPCKDVSPRAVITQIAADKAHLASIHPVRAPSGSRVVFRYKGLTLNQFDNILYNCRLKGYDETWRPTREREKEYENLKPGTYEFQVKAIDRDLNYSEPQSQELIVVPPPYRRPEFVIPSTVAVFALCLFIFQFFSHRRTAVRLKEELRQRITKELQDAHDMQMSLMSGPTPTFAGFEVYGRCEPAREVGGDFFRFIESRQEEEKFAIALSDVSGKGMKAAWIALLADGMIHAFTRSGWSSAGQLLSELNRGLYERRTDKITFVAFCFASIDIKEKTLQFSNAGQMLPIIRRGEDLITIAEVSGLPLGIMLNEAHREVYGERNVPLKEGDIIVFCTDGITEALNQRDEMYTSKRLGSMLRKADPGLSANQLVDEIFKDVDRFTGGADQYDDMTVVVLKVKGKGGGDIDG